MPKSDLAVATVEQQQTAYRRRFALEHWHPDVGRVDPTTFWLIWRDGLTWGLRNSASLSPSLQAAAECIMLLAQAQEAAPPVCPGCGMRLDEEQL